MTEHPAAKVRLDKWLWAARLFKTRNLAKQAIESGKVHYNDQRCKVSKEVAVGAHLQVRQGQDERELTVLALSAQRRSAAEAQLLYQESADSIARRESEAAKRQALRGDLLSIDERPNKKQRRQIHRFKRLVIDGGG